MSAITLNRHGKSRHLSLVAAEQEARGGSLIEPRWSPLVIRLAVAADAAPLRRLAQMDSAQPLSGQALLAEQGGSVIAALSLEDGRAISDPFLASADAAALLRLRAAQLRDAIAA